MSSYQIRPAIQKDVPAIANLVNSVYRGETGMRSWTTEASYIDGVRITEEALARCISAENCCILLATQKDQICGCVRLENREKKAFLSMLSVDADHQSAGLGTLLLERGENYVRAHFKKTVISLTVISVRTELLSWYERKGYRDNGERSTFPKDRADLGFPKVDLEFVYMDKILN